MKAMGRPSLKATRTLYQVMSDSEAKPSPIGEVKPGLRPDDGKKYENKSTLRLRSHLAEASVMEELSGF